MPATSKSLFIRRCLLFILHNQAKWEIFRPHGHIIINVHDQLTITLSILLYFVARESTSVMRQEQMMGGMISRICPLRFFYGFHAQEE